MPAAAKTSTDPMKIAASMFDKVQGVRMWSWIRWCRPVDCSPANPGLPVRVGEGLLIGLV